MEVTLDHEAIYRAQMDGALSHREAFALDALADTDEEIPEWLFDAVERLFLWSTAGETLH
jgi:hypothetical protein